MEFAEKGVQLTVPNDLFPDLVERIRKATKSIITHSDILETEKISPRLKVPFGDFYLEYSQANGVYLCTLTYREPEKHQDDQTLRELRESIKFF